MKYIDEKGPRMVSCDRCNHSEEEDSWSFVTAGTGETDDELDLCEGCLEEWEDKTDLQVQTEMQPEHFQALKLWCESELNLRLAQERETEALNNAAPEMLEALQGLIEWQAFMGGFDAPAWNKAYAALAKYRNNLEQHTALPYKKGTQ